jgi:universal stress protein A
MTTTTLSTTEARKTTAAPVLRFKKILAPVDFSPASENGFNYALRCAEEFGAELTVLHVLEPVASARFADMPGAITFPEIDFAAAEGKLCQLAATGRPGKVARPQWRIRTGVPSHEIVEAAREADVDLIVIATHGYTGWKHFCIGSTAERVVRAAPCPVLVVREKEHELS